MTHARTFWLSFTVLFAIVLGLRPAHGQDLESLYRHGIELRQQRSDAEALTVFTQAWNQSHAGRARAQMALAAQALGRWGEADAWLHEALGAGTDPWVRSHRAQLLGAQRTIALHTGAITVVTNIHGAEVSTGGRSLGQTPMSTPARVTAGTVVVEVRAPRYYPITRPVVVPVGGDIRETVDLVATREGDRTAGAPVILPAVLPIAPVIPPAPPPVRGRARRGRAPVRRPVGSPPQPTCAGLNHLSGERCCPPGSEWDPNQGGCVCQVPTLCGPPPTPTPPRGSVRVVIAPPPGGLPTGMTVTLDGTAMQPPAYANDGVMPGTHVVMVQAPGFNPARQSVTVSVGAVSAVAIELTRARTGPPAGTVRVVTPVPGAVVFLDGERMEGTPLERSGITPGTHALRITAPGFLPDVRNNVQVADELVTVVEVPSLRPEPEPPDVGTTGLELEADVGYGTFLATAMSNFANATGNHYNWGPATGTAHQTLANSPLPFSGSVASDFYLGGRLASAFALGAHFGYQVLTSDVPNTRGDFNALTAGLYLRIYFIPAALQWHFDPWIGLGVDYGRLSGPVVNQGVSAAISLGVQINVARALSIGPVFSMSMWFPLSICGYANNTDTSTTSTLCTDSIPGNNYRPDIGLFTGLGVRYTL